MSFRIKNLTELNDYLGFVVLSAPDRFPRVGPFGSDVTINLATAFDQLRDGLALSKGKINDSEMIEKLELLLNESHAAYLTGEAKRGAHRLQDVQDILFPHRFGARREHSE